MYSIWVGHQMPLRALDVKHCVITSEGELQKGLVRFKCMQFYQKLGASVRHRLGETRKETRLFVDP